MKHVVCWPVLSLALITVGLASCSDEAGDSGSRDRGDTEVVEGDDGQPDLAVDVDDTGGDLVVDAPGDVADLADDVASDAGASDLADAVDLGDEQVHEDVGNDVADDVAGDPLEDVSIDIVDARDVAEHDVVPDLGSDVVLDVLVDLGDTGPGLPDAPIYADGCRPRHAGTAPKTELLLHSILPSTPLIRDPVQLVAVPDGSERLVIVDQRGVLVITDPPVLPPDGFGVTSVETWLDISGSVDDGYSESGFLSVAFHPDFAENGELFLSYNGFSARSVIDTIVSRVTLDDDGVPDPATETVILEIGQPYSNHNGGQLMFGPDGYLYFGLGDGGWAGDPDDRAQDRDSLFGKLLRLDIDAPDVPYGIPADNPFVGDADYREEIYAWGLRNPWRFSFDPVDDTLWLGDVGQVSREEVDIIEAGGNYGWNIMEGFCCYNPSFPSRCDSPPGDCDDSGFEPPIDDYPRSLGAAVTGGFVYRGSRNPELVGDYIFGDYVSGRIWRLIEQEDGSFERQELRNTSMLLSSFGVDADNELYALDVLTDQAYWLEYVDDPGSPADWHDRLSDTGCMNEDGTAFAEGVLGYDVALPFWTDNAVKERGLALPHGAELTFTEEGPWGFPDGTEMVKTFRLNGQRIETRILTREAGEWLAMTYRWAPDGSDAFAVREPAEVAIGDDTWLFPAPTQCDRCHTVASGYLLGLRTPQLNTEYDMFGTGEPVNQIDALAEVGYFDDDLPSDSSGLPRFPTPDSDAPLEARARTYLDVNCANCHRPDGGTPTGLDLRVATPLDEMGACDVPPEQGDLGLSEPLIITPGIPGSSVLWHRIDRNAESDRMPPLGRYLTDTVGSGLVGDWIGSLTGCAE